MKKLLYAILIIYTILHVAVFTYYSATPTLSQTTLMFDAAQWVVPTILLFVLLIPMFERIRWPVRLITFVGLLFVVVCAILSFLRLPGLWWSWTTLGFVTLVVLIVLSETRLPSLAFAVLFLGLGSFEIIYQIGLWFYHDFFGSGAGSFIAVIFENLCWIVPSVVTILVLQRRYRIFKLGVLTYVFFGISIVCTSIWFATGMDIPLLWWKGVGPWANPNVNSLLIAISRGSQTFWILGIATMFMEWKVAEQLWKRLWKIRIFNFMVVGGIGFVVGTGLVYYPITVFIHSHVEFLSQMFYLPALIPSFFVSVTLNYYLNRRYTFGDCNTKKLSLLRYMSMGTYTWIFDVIILFLLVHFTNMFYLLALVIATLCMFLIRYIVSKRWIWNREKVAV